MIKKLLSLCLALIFVLQLFTIAVCAAPAISVEVAAEDAIAEILKVNGTITNDVVHENRLVTIVVTPKDVAVTEANAASFLAFAQAEANDEGEYEALVGFSHPDGDYDFHAIYETTEAKVTFRYISPVTFANYVRQIKNGAIPKANLYEGTAAYQNAIALDLNVFATDKDKEIFEYRLDKSRSLLTGATDTEIIEDFNEILAFADGECNFIEGLEAISYAGNYYKYLSDNQNFTKIDFAAYNALTEAQKDIVTMAFTGQKFENADKVKAYFDEKVTYAATQSGTGSVGDGIGGGVGGGAVTGGVATEGNVNDRYNYGEIGAEPEKVVVKFNDIYSVSWAAEAITKLAEAGIIDGVSEGKFEPNGLVTREQFAKLLAVTLGIYDVNANTDFTDAQGGWYTPYIASVKNAGLINGVGEGKFGVGRNITRQDMAVMIYNALTYKGVKLVSEKTDFTDFESIADYAKDAVKLMAGAGIINGMDNGSFAPNDNATRAQAAVLIYALKGRIE